MAHLRPILLLLTLCSLSALAVTGLKDPAFVASLSKTNGATAITPLADPSLRYWWVASDKPLSLKVTNWIDRVQSQVLTNETDASRPTNSASGVGFGGSHFLHFKPALIPAHVNINGTGTVCVIVTPTENNSTFDAIIASDDTVGSGLYTRDAGFFWANSAAQKVFAPLTYGRTMDVVVIITNATAGGYTYTNGVAALTFPSNLGDMTGSLTNVGKDQTVGNDFFKGFVQEIIFYSNVLSTVSISNLHFYATNTYGFSP